MCVCPICSINGKSIECDPFLEHFDASDIFVEERDGVEHEHLRLSAGDEAGALVTEVVVEGERVLRPPLDDVLVRLQLAVDHLGRLQPRLGQQDEVRLVLLRGAIAL